MASSRKPPTPEPDTDPGPDPLSERIGTVAEETARLLATLRGAGPSTAPSTSAGDATCAHHPPAGEAIACRLCPICQGIALLRGLHPETVDRLADLASAAADALRDLAQQEATTTRPAAAPSGPPSRSSSASPRAVDIPVDGEQDVLS